MNDKRYYVYQHVNPITNEIVYIGHGCNERAWVTRPGKGKKHGGGHRKPEHSEWCNNFMQAGLTPNDWVVILYKGLDKASARAIETQLIAQLAPLFNYKLGTAFKLSDEQLEECRRLREAEGLFYNQIASKLGVSTMTVWRRMND